MAFNYQALWGLVVAGGLVGATYKYLKNRGEKEVQILNVIKRTPEKDEAIETTRDRIRRARGSSRGVNQRGMGSIGTREQSFETSEPITERRRVQKISSRTASGIEQVQSSPSKATQFNRPNTSRVSRPRRFNRVDKID